MSHKFTVGDTLFFVTTLRYGINRVVTVEKVGRKWVTLSFINDCHRIRIDDLDMAVESPKYGPVGRCYLTEQQYNDERMLEKAWGDFRRKVNARWVAPDDVTVEWIADACKTLGLDWSAK